MDKQAIILVNIQIDLKSGTAVGTTATGEAHHIYRDHLGIWWEMDTDATVFFKKNARKTYVRTDE